MRIRRRPQALIPSLPPQQQASDPSQPPNAPGNQGHCLPQKQENYKPRRPHVDLGGDPSPAARRASLPPAHPQGDIAEGRSGGAAQRQQGAAADGHESLENGHRDKCNWPVNHAAGERPANGVMPAKTVMSSTTALIEKDGVKSDGSKRRRGSPVLLEGSRCSRVNGRGWRCSQPTLVGYSLCEHHLGKGRQSRSAHANGAGGRGAGVPKLGRTEPNGMKSAAPLALVVAATNVHEPVAHLAAEFS
ncbi:hypothetical protein ACQ4PT_031359 [Festuca glaucescens]